MKLKRKAFSSRADLVARNLLGKILVRKIGKKLLKARIIEVEAYFGENDPASWARFGKRKDNFVMWEQPGKILIKNVHMHNMLNFSTGAKGKAEAVLIRGLKPLNFDERCSGPGLLTKCLKINKKFNGKDIIGNKEIYIEHSKDKFKINRSFRIGVKKDLAKKYRFFINQNEN